MTPDEQIDDWIAADQSWVEQNYDILAAAYQHFLTIGEWPTVEQMIQQRARQGILNDAPRRASNTRPLVPGQGAGFRPDRIMMSVRHLVRFPEAEPLMELVARATRYSVILLGATDEPPRLTREQMIRQPPPLSPGKIALLPRFLQLVLSEYPRPFGGHLNLSGDWVLDVNVMAAIEFSSVATIADFVEIQREIIKKNLTQVFSDAREGELEVIGDTKKGSSGIHEEVPASAANNDEFRHNQELNSFDTSLLQRAFNNPWIVGIIVCLIVGILLWIYLNLSR